MELAEKIKTRILEEREVAEVDKGSYETLKRVFDVCFALILLPFLLPPMAIIAILIKLDSKGPIIFKNKRIGREGKRFFCYKFRTMVQNAEEVLAEILKDQRAEKEWKNCIKLKNDPRVTSFGVFLRKFSLDELPQIFNVLKGNMSFVGPRPILEEEIPKYGRDFESYQDMQPGITGLWQISGRNDCDYSNRIRFLKVYFKEKSFRFDLKIILKTLPTVLSRRGAY